MPSAIGIRVYKISIFDKANRRAQAKLNTPELTKPVPQFVESFIRAHSKIIQNSDLERSWYFERKDNENAGNCRGYVRYGTFGFESDFVDTTTKKHNYRRRTTDIEQIPLYFEYWFPKSERFGYVAFQSFQGRSCINLIATRMKAKFEEANPDFIMAISKLLPGASETDIYGGAPVKKLRFISRKAPSDLADLYLGVEAPDVIDFELSISARRKGTLGKFASLSKALRGKRKGVISYAGIDFPEAVAEVRVGSRIRRVGVVGGNSDAGVIDITEHIKRGLDGHPTFDSLKRETGNILESFYEVMRGDAS